MDGPLALKFADLPGEPECAQARYGLEVVDELTAAGLDACEHWRRLLAQVARENCTLFDALNFWYALVTAPGPLAAHLTARQKTVAELFRIGMSDPTVFRPALATEAPAFVPALLGAAIEPNYVYRVFGLLRAPHLQTAAARAWLARAPTPADRVCVLVEYATALAPDAEAELRALLDGFVDAGADADISARDTTNRVELAAYEKYLLVTEWRGALAAKMRLLAAASALPADVVMPTNIECVEHAALLRRGAALADPERKLHMLFAPKLETASEVELVKMRALTRLVRFGDDSALAFLPPAVFLTSSRELCQVVAPAGSFSAATPAWTAIEAAHWCAVARNDYSPDSRARFDRVRGYVRGSAVLQKWPCPRAVAVCSGYDANCTFPQVLDEYINREPASQPPFPKDTLPYIYWHRNKPFTAQMAPPITPRAPLLALKPVKPALTIRVADPAPGRELSIRLGAHTVLVVKTDADSADGRQQ